MTFLIFTLRIYRIIQRFKNILIKTYKKLYQYHRWEIIYTCRLCVRI